MNAGPALSITVVTPDGGVAHATPSEPAAMASAARAGMKRRGAFKVLMRVMIVLLFGLSDGNGRRLSVAPTNKASAGRPRPSERRRPRDDHLPEVAAVEA